MTEIIFAIEQIPETARTSEQRFMLLMAVHIKNLENKLSGLEAARNNGVVDAMDTEF